MTEPVVRPPLTPDAPYPAADKRTMYFIGVTTHRSSIMKVFPRWADFLGLGDVAMQGMNFQWHDEPENYRRAVEFIKRDPLSCGALVTTHKLDLLRACRDQFDRLDEFAELMGEVSSISKDGGQLVGHAKDPITSGLALEAFLPERHWERTGAEALVLGAGGSAIAVTWYMLQKQHGRNRPSRIVVTNRSIPRLDEIRELSPADRGRYPVRVPPHASANGHRRDHGHAQARIADHQCDRTWAKTRPARRSRIRPCGLTRAWLGISITAENCCSWSRPAAQPPAKNLQIEDGWIYFVHGWTRVIAEVFHIDIPTSGPVFDELARIAADAR